MSNNVISAPVIYENFNDALMSLVPENSLVPPQVLQNMLNNSMGTILAGATMAIPYSNEEKCVIYKGMHPSHKRLSPLIVHERPLWISSAGGPGAGKTTTLLKFVGDTFKVDMSGLKAADWSAPALKNVLNTVLNKVDAAFVSADRCALMDLAKEMDHCGKSDEAFYRQWRSATNFMSNLDMSRAFHHRFNVVHDTTLAGFLNLPAAQKAGYYTTVVMTAAPIETREEAANQRNAVFFQSLHSNIREQDEKFGKNLPNILKHADEFHIYWRDTANEMARPVAVIQGGMIAVSDEASLHKVAALYPVLAAEILPNLPRMENAENGVKTILERQKYSGKRAKFSRLPAVAR